MKGFSKNVFLMSIALIMLFCIIISGCSGEGLNSDNKSSSNQDNTGNASVFFSVSVTENSDKYEIISSNPVSVESGGNAVFVLKMKDNYCIDKVVRQGVSLNAGITNDSNGIVTVALEKIQYSLRVNIECVIADTYVAYYPNGGMYIDGRDMNRPYTARHSLKSRLRPNSEIGTNILYRTGYVLIGWNINADGSGEHIGLGSRVTVHENKTLNLYAQWRRMTDSSDFEYTNNGNSVSITGYKGRQSSVVVPDKINGIPVELINARAFSGNIDIVVFPSSIKKVEPKAFVDCNVKELYFYDNLTEIYDYCFSNCPNFSTIHINAILSPRYGPENLYSEYSLADKYDILILNSHKKKVLIFGGSGAYISVDTKQIEKELDDYICINMAVNGWFNAPAQFDMMLPYLGKDDIFVHAPESSSMYGFMYDITMTPTYNNFTYNRLRFYTCLESNYDLISLIDVRNVSDLLSGFSAFNILRQSLPALSYTDYLTEVNLSGVKYKNDTGWIDERGNFAFTRLSQGDKLDTGEADIVPEYILDETANVRLNTYYAKIRAVGAEVCFITAPVNKDALLKRLNDDGQLPPGNNYLLFERPSFLPKPGGSFDKWVKDFENAVDEHLDCHVLAPLSETLFSTQDFFDSDYHLADAAVPVYTQKIINALKIQKLPKTALGNQYEIFAS